MPTMSPADDVSLSKELPDEIAVPAATEDAPPDSLHSIWDSPYLVKQIKGNSAGWTCYHCGEFFKQQNATKALCHVAQTKGQNIRHWPTRYFSVVLLESGLGF